jgi:hypothetical protein
MVMVEPQQPPMQPPPPAQKSDSSLLPEGWRIEVDPTSGREYFYNEDSGESSWTMPEKV